MKRTAVPAVAGALLVVACGSGTVDVRASGTAADYLTVRMGSAVSAQHGILPARRSEAMPDQRIKSQSTGDVSPASTSLVLGQVVKVEPGRAYVGGDREVAAVLALGRVLVPLQADDLYKRKGSFRIPANGGLLMEVSESEMLSMPFIGDGAWAVRFLSATPTLGDVDRLAERKPPPMLVWG